MARRGGLSPSETLPGPRQDLPGEGGLAQLAAPRHSWRHPGTAGSTLLTRSALLLAGLAPLAAHPPAAPLLGHPWWCTCAHALLHLCSCTLACISVHPPLLPHLCLAQASFLLVTSERTKRNGLKLHRGRLSLDIRKNLFPERVIKHWSRLPGEVAESPSFPFTIPGGV